MNETIGVKKSPETLRVTLELTYADMAMVEFALINLLDEARDKVTHLQDKEEAPTPDRATAIKMYNNRIRKAKHLVSEVGAVLAMAADAYMIGDV